MQFQYPLRKWSGDEPKMMRRAKPRVYGTPLGAPKGKIPPKDALTKMLEAYRAAKKQGMRVDAMKDALVRMGCRRDLL